MENTEPTIRFACPDCGKRLAAPEKHAGRETKCPACQQTVTVPETAKPQPRIAPQRFTVACRLCETRVEVTERHIGKKLKCPDCGALTPIKRPEAKPEAKRPQAMDGWQYEVYEGEDQPWAADLIAKQKETVPVACRLCGTLMHVPPSVIGKLLVCPDCGAKTRVEPPAPKGEKPKLAPPGKEYQIDESEASPEPIQHHLYEEKSENPPAGFRELVEARKRRKSGRPTPPRFALIVGVMKMWRTSGMLLAGVGFSFTLLALVAIGGIVLSMLSGGGMGAAMGIVFVPIPLCLGFLWAAAFSVVYIELIVESSEGNDTIQSWPQIDIHQLSGPIAYTLMAAIVAFIPGWLIGEQVLPILGDERLAEPGVAYLASMLGAWIAYPVIQLSQLELSSVFGVLSLKVLRTFGLAPMSWAFFFFETAIMAATIWGAGWLISEITPFSLVGALSWLAGMALILPFFLLMYARLLGRLSWIVANAEANKAAADEAEEEG